MRSLLTLIFLYCFASPLSYARENRPFSLSEKISRSDVILIGRVKSIDFPKIETPGVYGYATIEVEKTLKGDGVGRFIMFVTKGYSAELNPLCCSVGKKYLIFAQNGFDIFDIEGDDISITRQGIDKYYAAVNGSYSAYEVNGKGVVGWPSQQSIDMPKSTRQIIREIKIGLRRGIIDN